MRPPTKRTSVRQPLPLQLVIRRSSAHSVWRFKACLVAGAAEACSNCSGVNARRICTAVHRLDTELLVSGGTGRPRPQPGPARQPRGRPPAIDREVCKRRNVVEPCSNRLKQWRGIATRYDKTAQSYEAVVTLASLLM
jgi:hypothetical protein